MNYFSIPFVQLENYELDTETVNIIPKRTAKKLQVIAISKLCNILTVGMVTPENVEIINKLERKLKCKIMPIKIDIQEWANKLNSSYIKEKV